ncbi:peptide chain release factor N(5)-glutamine methyltransferase [Paradevosia shaoguanensis]|uniref:Release factor glutamine methyltransferase n=1 Tax=Paradevosia shaoguanensis TaxID=1335043 RepID=A0AA41QT77_9HYPH|nr:peptide chain release factor N(5)-glutamine methyltransferase [Paradevosia shaoguanensis]MCI0129549.1 peptide chain release factor N(5)-glutamine methyltransferase [Paradevosia shaoguanensis]
MRDRFRAAGLDTPELDARILAQAAFGFDSLGLLGAERDSAPAEGLARLDGFAERRLAGEPVARILGEKEFYGLPFGLNAATLVPRPDTELLVELALDWLGKRNGARLLDLGTGSGAIPVAILANSPGTTGLATDLSEEALAAARENARRNGVGERLEFRQGSWFAPVAGERFDLIVSNPPYIETDVIASLMPEVRDFDPLLALDGGPDGLGPYRIIAAQAGEYLRRPGALMVEIGSGQGEAVTRIFADAGFSGVRVEKDLAGLDRVVIAHQL